MRALTSGRSVSWLYLLAEQHSISSGKMMLPRSRPIRLPVSRAARPINSGLPKRRTVRKKASSLAPSVRDECMSLSWFERFIAKDVPDFKDVSVESVRQIM
jgi:hypothetical protein